MLGDDLTAALSELQAHAVSRMRDACRINSAGSRVLDRQTGRYVDTPGVLLYEGRCRVRRDTADRVVTAGGQQVTTRPYIVSIPAGEGASVTPGCVVTMTASADPYLAARELTVLSVEGGTDTTARRIAAHVIEG